MKRTGLLVAMCASALFSCGAFTIDQRLYFRGATFDPLPLSFPHTFDHALRTVGILGEGPQRAYVVQFEGPLSPEASETLRARFDLRLDSFVPNDGYLEILGTKEADALADHDLVRALIPYHPSLKYEAVPRMLRDTPEGARFVLSVTLFPEMSLAPLKAIAEESGGSVLAVTDDRARGGALRAIVAVADPSGIDRLAALPLVQWIEEEPVREAANDVTTRVVQSGNAADTPVWSHALHGEGQIVGIIDDPIDTRSCFFADGATPRRKIVRIRNAKNDVASNHGTHVAGIVCGDRVDAPGADDHRGLAWAARLTFGNLSDFFLRCTTPPCSKATFFEYLDAAHRDLAHVHNNSWVSASGSAFYTLDAHDLDLFTAANECDLVIAATSNDPRFIASPADARNSLAVAASGRYPQHLRATGGGHGPTRDERRKPEVLAPGDDVVSAVRANAQDECRTAANSGASMAAPAVSAAALLVRQYLTEGWFPSGTRNPTDMRVPSAALLKAMILNGARDMDERGYGGPIEGFGFPVLDDVLHFKGDTRGLQLWDVMNADGLASNESRTYEVALAPGEPLKVTLVWTDPANALAAGTRVANDLDLTVTAGGSTYRGNVFGTSGGIAQSIPGGRHDLLDNVEMVYLANPGAGTVTMTVTRRRLGRPAPQGFALVVTGAIAK